MKAKVIVCAYFLIFINLYATGLDTSLVGKVAPSWVLKSNTGKIEFLNNYCAEDGNQIRKAGGQKENNVVVLSFFATWCGPCIKEINELQILQDKYKDDPVTFFLIDLTDYYRSKGIKSYKDAPKTDKYLNKKGLNKITILYDDRGLLAKDYNADNVLPRLFVIDKDQVIRLDEKNICPSCIQDDLSVLINSLL
tara:strand:- start:773 stop:1354 length:582 start_codon:yes stop_codon:yes gene_type:complete